MEMRQAEKQALQALEEELWRSESRFVGVYFPKALVCDKFQNIASEGV